LPLSGDPAWQLFSPQHQGKKMSFRTKAEFQRSFLQQTDDGFALASVLLVIVVLSLTAIPLLDMVIRNRENATTIQII
jgi:hypothetical protein